MSDEATTNRAVRVVRSVYAGVAALDGPPDLDLGMFAADFLCEDRRAGGVSFGRMNAPEYIAAIRGLWDVARHVPKVALGDVIGVRGDRLAAFEEGIDLADGMHLHGVTVWQLDESLAQLQRVVWFDIDGRAAALAALDLLHAESGNQ